MANQMAVHWVAMSVVAKVFLMAAWMAGMLGIRLAALLVELRVVRRVVMMVDWRAAVRDGRKVVVRAVWTVAPWAFWRADL